MSRILDQKKFCWTPSWNTDITATFRKHGFVSRSAYATSALAPAARRNRTPRRKKPLG